MVVLVCLATGVAYVMLFQFPSLDRIPMVAVDITTSGNQVFLLHKSGDALTSGTFYVTVNGNRVADANVSLAGGAYPWSPGEQLVVTYAGTSAIRDVNLIYAGPRGPVVLASAYFPGPVSNSTPVNRTTTGSIAVTSAPAGAGIRLDTSGTGSVTPAMLTNVSPGQHRIDLDLTGYYPANSTVSVTTGSTVNADFTLVKEITNGSITVTSNPAGAGIRLDTSDTSSVTPATLANVSPGQHRIDLDLPGYYPANSTVSVTAGSTVNADFTLVKETPTYSRYPGFTAEAWVKWNGPPTAADQQWAMIVVDGDSDGNRVYQIGHNMDNTRFEFRIRMTNNQEGLIMSDTQPQAGIWYHVAEVYNQTPGTFTILVNGNPEQGTGTWSPDPGGMHSSTGIYQVGGPSGISYNGASNQRKFNGDIRGLSIYQEALTPAEILAHYRAGAP